MIEEHDSVILTRDVSEYGLKAGDAGAVVSVHGAREAYEVEFMTVDGMTVAVCTLEPEAVRPLNGSLIPNYRQIAV